MKVAMYNKIYKEKDSEFVKALKGCSIDMILFVLNVDILNNLETVKLNTTFNELTTNGWFYWGRLLKLDEICKVRSLVGKIRHNFDVARNSLILADLRTVLDDAIDMEKIVFGICSEGRKYLMEGMVI